MNTLHELRLRLQHHADPIKAQEKAIFFKTGKGEYAEHDKFIGISVPVLRTIAKEYTTLTQQELQALIASPSNEERFIALVILVNNYQKAEPHKKEVLYQFYLSNLQHINNWNLVDASAHLIIGAHLLKANKELLLTLAQSKVLWERRIAIVAAWYFIRHNNLEWTFKLAKLLLNDTHNLMHKATGWMLREAGKRNQNMLIAFLDEHADHMPRTMLRYSIEKFAENDRKYYLKKGKRGNHATRKVL